MPIVQGAGQDIDLFELAIKQQAEADLVDREEEATVLIVGSKQAGKTSMILRFLDRDEVPKPTVALEYTFGRRSQQTKKSKDIGHMWELGGVTWLLKLVDVPINPEDIQKTSVTIVLDLSKPNELWYTLETLLGAVRARVEAMITEATKEDNTLKDEMSRKAKARYGEEEEHADVAMVDPFPIPLVIVGSKYDVFQDEFDSEKKKIICRTLRFVSHMYGAHLMFFSTKQDATVKQSKAILSHLLFNTPGPKKLEVDHNRALVVPCGMDSLQSIGSPMLAESDIGRMSARNPLDLWKQAYQSYFPQESQSDPSLVVDPSKDPAFAEAVIDSQRVIKDQEMERLRRASERKLREIMAANTSRRGHLNV